MSATFVSRLNKVLTAAVFVTTLASTVHAEETTYISGTFDGCEYGKAYQLDNGQTMVCQSYRYHYAYHPEVTIVDSYTVVIDDDEYSVNIQ